MANGAPEFHPPLAKTPGTPVIPSTCWALRGNIIENVELSMALTCRINVRVSLRDKITVVSE